MRGKKLWGEAVQEETKDQIPVPFDPAQKG
jgi:hypothetical protein